MTAKEQLDSHQYLFLQHIHEAAANFLQIVVREGRVSGPPKDIRIGEQVISGGIPIDVMGDSPTYEILFPNYIAYSVRNESYVQHDPEEVFEGKRLRTYTKSKFLDFVTSSTFASTEYPGTYHHFEVVTENQIIDVAACEQPSVKILENAEQQAARPAAPTPGSRGRRWRASGTHGVDSVNLPDSQPLPVRYQRRFAGHSGALDRTTRNASVINDAQKPRGCAA